MAQTTKIKHEERAHALLSPSGASRWMTCTPSAKLEAEYGERKSSAFAAEGTLAHELAELYLRKDVLRNISGLEFDQKLEEIMSNDLFSDEMIDMVAIYTEYCEGQYLSAKTENIFADIEIEQRFDLTEYVPESFGTGDCCIISEPVLEIIDLKYGKGVPVYADWNTQLMQYGLGALRKYDTLYDIETIKLTIVQPRLNNISTFTMSVDELRAWAEEELKPKAQMAFNGEGELVAGDHCRFCAVKNRCRKLYEQQLEIAKYDFRQAELLSDDEIVDILKRVPRLVEWANSIQAYAQDAAVNSGKTWPGYKLVAGVSRRAWLDEDNAMQAIFARFPELSEDQIFETKLKSITAIEKIVGKKRFSEVMSDVVVKPEGKPTLVPMEDKRPALGFEQAKADFSD